MSRWFAENSGKAWTEKWFLIYSPIWMAVMGVVMVFGLQKSMNDMGYALLGLGLALPCFLIPALLSPENRDKAFYQTYWFKANVYLFIFSFFGSYFGTQYFFDLLGMVYHYPNLHWHFESRLLGCGGQVVPFIMYPTAFFYFMTYHSSATVVLRRIYSSGIPAKKILFPVAVFVIAYFWSYMETKMMANPMIKDNFYYKKMDLMLTYGSAIYAIYFVCSFPIYYWIDEDDKHPWTVRQVCAGALSASLLTMFGLDLVTHWIGSL